MMPKPKARVILKESASQEKLDHVAWRKNWLWWQEVPRSEKNPYEKIWITKDQQTSIHYIEDHLIQINYFLVEGSERDRIVKEIHSSFETYDNGDILQMAKNANNRDERIHATYCAAIAAPQQFDSTFFKIIEDTGSDPDPEVRHAAIVAIGYIGWPEFRETLERMKTTDQDASVRRDADIMLEGLSEQWKTGS